MDVFSSNERWPRGVNQAEKPDRSKRRLTHNCDSRGDCISTTDSIAKGWCIRSCIGLQLSACFNRCIGHVHTVSRHIELSLFIHPHSRSFCFADLVDLPIMVLRASFSPCTCSYSTPLLRKGTTWTFKVEMLEGPQPGPPALRSLSFVPTSTP